MHLKNFSVITRDGMVELSPAYDFLNTTVAYEAIGKKLADIEEVALPIKGKMKNLTRSLWINYFAGERMGLNGRIVEDCLQGLRAALPGWQQLLDVCFLSDDQKRLYRDLLVQRCRSLGV